MRKLRGPKPMLRKVVEVWSVGLSRLSRSEGWDLFNCDGTMMIHRCDEDPGPFTRDDQAVCHVIDRALKGSRRHLLALYLEGWQFDRMIVLLGPFVAVSKKRRRV